MRKIKKVAAFVALFLLVFSTVAFAKVPEGTVVLGNKAYNQNCLVDSNVVEEVRQLIVAGNPIYYKDLKGVWHDLYNNYAVIDAKAIPAVDYLDVPGGPIVSYAAQDGDQVVVKVSSANAVNGKLTVVLSEVPKTAPVVGDFSITMAINGGVEQNVVPSAIAWTAETKTAQLTIPEISVTKDVQNVVFAVAYKNTTKINANLVIAASTVDALAAVNAAATVADMKKALEANAAVLGLDMVKYNKLSDDQKTEVANVVLKGKLAQPNGQYADAAAVKAAFEYKVNEYYTAIEAKAAVDAVNAVKIADPAKVTEVEKAEMLNVLKANATVLGLVFTDYDKLGNYGKDQVISGFIAQKVGAAFANAGEIKAAFEVRAIAQLTALTNAMTAVNTATEATIEKAINDNAVVLELSLVEFKKLGAAYQTSAAQAVVKARPVIGYADAKAIQAAIDAAVKAENDKLVPDAVKAINAAATTDVMINALKANASLLGIDLTDFNTLAVKYQTAVAQIILDGKVTQPNASYTAATIKVAFNAAVANQKAVAIADVVKAVNDVKVVDVTKATAQEIANMKAVLENAGNAAILGLAIDAKSDYANLKDQTPVSKAVITNRGEGYTTTAAIKAVFDNAVAAQKTIESDKAVKDAILAVNTALTTANMTTALVNNATILGIEVGDKSAYAALNAKDAVAQTVIDKKAIQPDQVYATTAAIKAVFDEAVAYRTQIEQGQSVVAAINAVNAADTIENMKAALANKVFGLAMGENSDYASLRTNFCDKAVQAIIDGKPYTTKALIQTAFVNAVSAQKADQLKEDAAIDAVNAVKVEVVEGKLNITPAVIADMKAALANNSAALGILMGADSSYDAISADAKNEVIKAVIVARPEAGYAKEGGRAAIAKAFNDEVANRTGNQKLALDAVNAANTRTAMLKAINDFYVDLALDVTVFNTLRDDYKNLVADGMMNGKVAYDDNKYPDSVAIKATFNVVVANNKKLQNVEDAAIAAVNTATVDTIQSVLEKNAAILKLDLAEYNKLTDAYKTAAAKGVVANKPEKGFVDLAGIQAAIDASVAVQMTNLAVDEVNAATTPENMVKVIEKYYVALGIDPIVYGGLTADKKTAGATALLNAKVTQPDGLYTSASVIRTIFNNAVSAQVEKAHDLVAKLQGTSAVAYVTLTISADGKTITATIIPGQEASLLKSAVVIQELVIQDIVPSTVKIGGTAYTVDLKNLENVRTALAKLAGKATYDEITLADLQGDYVTVTVDGFTFKLVLA